MRVAIIGGGAAGLMTAATITELDPTTEVFLIEKNNELGKKVLISGGGRCNVTTGIQDVNTVLKKYPRGGTFLSAAMHQFPPEAVFQWFEARGVPLKTEEDLRVFPASNNGADIVGVFTKLFKERATYVQLNTHVQSIRRSTEGFEIKNKSSDKPLLVDQVVLTTGGQAYRQTGSTGDGYAFACSLGHTLTPLAPSLNAFFTRETWPYEISGLSFEEATISCEMIKSAKITGPFLFTHKGISGPAVFAISSLVAFEAYDQTHPLTISIDLFPSTPSELLTNHLRALIARQPKKSFGNVLGQLIPKSLAAIMIELLALPAEKHAGEMSKQELHRCTDWLKHIPLQVVGRGAGDEFVTAGGIDTAEVNPRTMESRICPGLFFAGEILNIDGFTGGFNLQASWATGSLAGQSIASRQ